MSLISIHDIWRVINDLWQADEVKLRGRRLEDKDIGRWSEKIAREVAAVCPIEFNGKKVEAHGKYCGNHGEYLLDQAWRIIVDDRYAGLLLAMECELSDPSDEGRWHDFYKLTDVRADLRVFVGAVPAKDGKGAMDKFVNEIKALLPQHQHVSVDDAYLIALYYKGADRPDDALHGWIIYGDGRLKELR